MISSSHLDLFWYNLLLLLFATLVEKLSHPTEHKRHTLVHIKTATTGLSSSLISFFRILPSPFLHPKLCSYQIWFCVKYFLLNNYFFSCFSSDDFLYVYLFSVLQISPPLPTFKFYTNTTQ